MMAPCRVCTTNVGREHTCGLRWCERQPDCCCEPGHEGPCIDASERVLPVAPTPLDVAQATGRILRAQGWLSPAEAAALRAQVAPGVIQPDRSRCGWCLGKLESGQDLRVHLQRCPEHPMREVERERNHLRAALQVFRDAWLSGRSDELEAAAEAASQALTTRTPCPAQE